MKKYYTYGLIDSVDFEGRPDIDMYATEIETIRQKNIENLGRLDHIDLMYDAYKLGLPLYELHLYIGCHIKIFQFWL